MSFFSFQSWMWVGACLSILGVATGRCAAAEGSGDRIQFSEVEVPGGLVQPGYDPLERAGRFEMLPRGGSMGGVMESAPSAGPALQTPNARMLDLMDQRRNWIHATEFDSGRVLTAEDAMGVRRAGMFGAGSSSRNGLTDFFGSDPSGTTGGERGEASAVGFQDALKLDNYRLGSLGGGALGAFGTGPSVSGGRRGTAAGGLSGVERLGGLVPIGGAAVGASVGELNVETDRNSRAGSVRDLLAGPDAIQPLVSGFDPINLRIDTTRQELNPSVPRRSLDVGAETGGAAETLNEAWQRAASRSLQPGLVDRLDNLAPDARGGRSSLTPVVRLPSDSRPAQSPLRFGEFPTRKF
jgi:hypothetical protein